MFKSWSSVGAVVMALGLALAAPPTGTAQTRSRYYSYPGTSYSQPAPGAVIPERVAVPAAPRSPAYVGYPNNNSLMSIGPGYLPTYMTSINYPWLYGAYSYGSYEPGSYIFGAMPTSFNVNPTWPAPTSPASSEMPRRTATVATTRTVAALSPATTAEVNVRVPDDADVWIQGEKMSASGTERRFVSPPLTPGTDYVYDIRAAWTEGGRDVTQTRRVNVQAGSHETVTFSPMRSFSTGPSFRSRVPEESDRGPSLRSTIPPVRDRD
jgi:uncharacterized protein (TIGR03000 family)